MNKSQEIKSCIAYLFVGGCAAIVEWITFWLTDILFHFLVSTTLSFASATYFNYILGKKIAFKNYKKRANDIIMVYIVSGIGLLLNLALMYIFVNKINMTPILGKIISTGIVFFWNYSSRRIFIYKN